MIKSIKSIKFNGIYFFFIIRKSSNTWFGKGFLLNSANGESKASYPWQCYDLPGENETKPPTLPIDKEESKLFENEKKRGTKYDYSSTYFVFVYIINGFILLVRRDSKNNSNKAKAAAITIEMEETTPKKKSRGNSTNPRKGGTATKRKNSTKAGATGNPVSMIDADIMADNTGKLLFAFDYNHIDYLAYCLYFCC